MVKPLPENYLPKPKNDVKSDGVFWVYMVKCKFGTYYTGWTNDLEKRILAHNEGRGAKYLRGKGPVKLVYQKVCLSVQEAQAQERLIKKYTRKKKEDLLLND